MGTRLSTRPSAAARMTYRRSQAAPRLPDSDDPLAFRLIAILPGSAPEGHAGRDWFVYRIAQGANVITGYRRGDLPAVTAEVERIVVGLNERLMKTKGRPGPKPKSTTPAAQPAPQSPGDDESE
jgi:hypothetical protein